MRKLLNSKLSLRWKWAVLLTMGFVAAYLLISYALVSFIKQQQWDMEKQNAHAYANDIVYALVSEDTLSSKDYADLLNRQSDNRTHALLAGQLDQEGIIIRLLDNQQRIVYESSPLPKINFDGKLGQTEGTYNDQTVLVETRDLVQSNGPRQGYVQLVFTLERYYQRVANIDGNYLLISMISILICALIANGMAYYFFKPIKHMTDIMRELKEDAETKKRMDLSKRRYDELTDLSVGFNDLLDTMDLYINQQKQFVEDVSHELRTPVAIVEGHLKLLNRWGKDDPQVLEESLSASLSEIGRMKLLVQEMLDLSRAEQVGIHYKNEVTEVLGLVNQIHQSFQLIHEDFHFTLEIDGNKKEEIYVNISRNHLEQVLIILLDNAVKYSTDKPYIHMSVSKTLNNVQISIQDFGEGIAPADMEKVFARFYRVDKARSRNKGGNGLGLAIAKELIEGYKGTIQVESVLHNGSTFRIELPILMDTTKIIQAKRKQ